MTEDEAKAKVCPQTMTGERAPDGSGICVANCIGSACMAWRRDGHDAVIISNDAHINAEEFPATWAEYADATYNGAPAWRKVRDLPASGFCGLASKP